MLKAGGRAGIVIKNTFLSNSDNASVTLRKLLLESCNLHTVLDCPGGTFQGAGRSEEHTSELQSLMRISYAVFCLKTKTSIYQINTYTELHKHNSISTRDV